MHFQTYLYLVQLGTLVFNSYISVAIDNSSNDKFYNRTMWSHFVVSIWIVLLICMTKHYFMIRRICLQITIMGQVFVNNIARIKLLNKH